MATINELLKSLQYNVSENKKTLENNKDTWSRISKKDSFSELGLEPSELDTFLKEWINDNPYSSIK